MDKPNFCLVMIVRDEEPNICRALESVIEVCDNYVICDTGSVDRTKEVIKEFMDCHGKPGHVIEQEWTNFGVNKSYLMQQAYEANLSNGAKYLFWLDADEVWRNEEKEYPTAKDAGRLLKFLDARPNQGIFMMQTEYGRLNYQRWQAVRNNQLYVWKSPAHEYLEGTKPCGVGFVPFINVLARREGNSSRDPNRVKKYVQMFEEFLKENPDRPRETYYLGQSYQEAGMFDEAIETLTKRTKLGGFAQERYISHLRVGRLYKLAKKNYEKAEEHFKAGLTFNRPEVAFELLLLYQHQKRYAEGAELVKKLPQWCGGNISPNVLFAETPTYNYKYLFQASFIAHLGGDSKLAVELGEKVLEQGIYPSTVKEILERNLHWFKRKQNESQKTPPQVPVSTSLSRSVASSTPLIFPRNLQRVVIFNDFFPDPDAVRKFALSQEFDVKGNYPGVRTKSFATDQHKGWIEEVMRGKITYWPTQYNGAFQVTNASQKSWIHRDNTDYSAIIYLTPKAPLHSGTTLFRHKATGETYETPLNKVQLNADSRNYDAWEVMDEVGNIYNRMVIFNGRMSHQSTDYFGHDMETGRLFMLFFFNMILDTS